MCLFLVSKISITPGFTEHLIARLRLMRHREWRRVPSGPLLLPVAGEVGLVSPF